MAKPVGRPRSSDTAIVAGARRALTSNPRASMAELSRAIGVGMSAIYLRFPSREALLRCVAEDFNREYDAALTRAENDLDTGADGRAVLEQLLTAIVQTNLHRLNLALAGTFIRSKQDLAESARLQRRGRRLVQHLRTANELRPGVTWEDLGKALEAISSVNGADEMRSAALRMRLLDVMITGFVGGTATLPGTPPVGADFAENT